MKTLKDVIGPENIVCGRFRASFSPKILQAVSVKGLKGLKNIYREIIIIDLFDIALFSALLSRLTATACGST